MVQTICEKHDWIEVEYSATNTPTVKGWQCKFCGHLKTEPIKESVVSSVEEAAGNDYPYGYQKPIGSKERALFEEKKQSFINGSNHHKETVQPIIESHAELLEALSNCLDIIRPFKDNLDQANTGKIIQAMITERKANKILNK